MTLSLIVAMTEAGVIGRDNQLPWHIPEDLKRFKALTTGHPILMGRKTFESIGRPLPGRTNIVVTRNPDWRAEGALAVPGFEEAIQAASRAPGGEEIFAIGGAAIFREAWPRAERLYLTLIHADVPGDTYFPEIDWARSFEIIDESRGTGPPPARLSYSFVSAIRRPPAKETGS